ncbi:Sorting assembly machinery 35 kDa subunit [Nakaseomyces bracarensis]|uniref:Sorting assembly machinery 35 kDa subunit n=1 Tax=Nakaseomyces bracarensis TaxID=273131 RepID=A0ABR4NTV3_9SACH
MVPGSVKWVFDRFPIVKYEMSEDNVTPYSSDKLQRIFPFCRKTDSNPKSAKQDKDSFQLGVYEVQCHSYNGHKMVLASDPLCLYVQLSLCHKNNFKLPIVYAEDNGSLKTNESGQIRNDFKKEKDYIDKFTRLVSDKESNTLVVLSEKAHRDERLPILIETTIKAQKDCKRFVRSMDSLMIVLDSKLDHKERAIGKLLDTTVYDCFVKSVVQDGMTNEIFGSSPDILQTLAKRNQFFTRHNLSKDFFDPLSMYPECELKKLQESTKETLLLIQELYKDFSMPLKLKIAGYVIPLANIPSFKGFMHEQGKMLTESCTDLLGTFC